MIVVAEDKRGERVRGIATDQFGGPMAFMMSQPAGLLFVV